MNEQGTETAADPVAAAAARAELRARAERLRASGWTDADGPPEWPEWLITKDAATDEQRLAHRRAVVARARKLVARLDAQQRDRLVYKVYTPPPSPPETEAPIMENTTMSLRDVFSVEQADAIQGVLNRALEALAEEAGRAVAQFERELKNEMRAKFAEFENRQLQQENMRLRSMLEKSDDSDVIDFPLAKRAVNGS